MSLVDGMLSISQDVLYTVPSGYRTVIREILISATEGEDVSFDLYINSTGTPRPIIDLGTTLGGGKVWVDARERIMEEGERIEGKASSAERLHYLVSGYKVYPPKAN